MIRNKIRKIRRILDGGAQRRLEEISAHMRLGFVEAGLVELQQIASSHRRRAIREKAAFNLLAWQLSSGAEDLSFDLAEAVLAKRSLPRASKLPIPMRLLFAEGHLRNKDIGKARRALGAMSAIRNQDVLLCAANLECENVRKIELLNSALAAQGTEGVWLDDADGATFDRLIGRASAYQDFRGEGPLVSVIVPVFNAATTISTALKALRSQTHQNLEILIVDDCSTDGTPGLVESAAEEDGRIRLIRSPDNLGCYNARNLGLQAARGEFVTCHDADDWSHPRKIETQVKGLLENSDQIANLSQWVRADEMLNFEFRPLSASYVHMNFSSLMFRRSPVLEHVGYWDTVRYAGDSEFIKRLERYYGKSRVAVLPELLAVGRRASGSLTRSADSALYGVLSGSRLYYQWRFQLAHESGLTRFAYPQAARAFEVPHSMRPRRQRRGEPLKLDAVFAADLRHDVSAVLGDLADAADAGLAVGLVHLPHRRGTYKDALDRRIMDAVDKGRAHFIPHGAKARARCVIVRNANAVRCFNRYVPEVEAEKVVLVPGNETHASEGQSAHPSLRECEEVLARYFPQPFIWCAENERDRELLASATGETFGSLKDLWNQVPGSDSQAFA